VSPTLADAEPSTIHVGSFLGWSVQAEPHVASGRRCHLPQARALGVLRRRPAIHTALAPYHPDSIDGDEPLLADGKHGGYVPTPRVIEGKAVRAQPVSFDDHFSPATVNYRSLSLIEQTHVVEAFTFELGKVYEQAIKERELGVLANVDTDLCERVAACLRLPAPKGTPAQDIRILPALVQLLAEPGSIVGRKITVDRTLATARSIEFDALVVAGDTTPSR
jgi:catalase